MNVWFWFSFVLISFLASCAPQPVKKQDVVFYPPPPNPPRVQFLQGISSSRDVQGDSAEYSLFSVGLAQDEEVKRFMKPYGIALSGDSVYISDTIAAKIAVINFREKTFNWLKGNFGPGKLDKPINLATDNQGNLYVADTKRKLVVAFDSQQNFLRTYGQGLDMKPVDIAADDRHVYVLDFSRSQILVFKKSSGKLVESLGQGSDNPQNNLALPTNMTLDHRGVFYVTNFGNGKVVQLDRDGNVLSSVGQFGQGFAQFGRPRGIDTDVEGRMYVADAQHHNVQLFNEDGRLLMFFGDPTGNAGTLNLPAGIAVTDQNLDYYQTLAAPGFELEQVVLVVSQAGPNKLSIYGLGKKRGVDYEAYYREVQELMEERKKENEKKQDEKKTK